MKKCEKCASEFVCNPSGNCWCKEIILSKDKLNKIKSSFGDCLCPKCLDE